MLLLLLLLIQMPIGDRSQRVGRLLLLMLMLMRLVVTLMAIIPVRSLHPACLMPRR